MENILPKRVLLIIMMAWLETWFMFRFGVDMFSGEHIIFTVGICLVAIVGGWALPAQKVEDDEE